MASPSQSLVPAGSNFQQQGAVDWVNLGNSSLNFTVNVLSRLANAGIQPFTLAAAYSVCSLVKIGSDGEMKIQTAVSKLKAFNTMNSMLTYGFGIKHIIRILAELEQGIACISICACLTEMYGVEMSAKILRELYLLADPPSDLRPSFRQWHSLVEVCQGTLAATNFGDIIHQFNKISDPNGQIPEDLKMASEPKVIAKAMHNLFELSRGDLEKVTFL